MANTYTQLAVDTFQRADENPLSDGGLWSTAAGFSAMKLVSHLAEGSTFASCLSDFSGVSWPADQYAEMIWSAGNLGPALRFNGTSAYVLEVVSGSQWWITIRPADTILVTGAAQTLSAGDVLRLEIVGTTINSYRNGTLIVTIVDATLASGTPGIWANNPSGQASQWDGGSIYAGTVSSIGLVPSSVTYPTTSTGTVTLSVAAPTGGIVVNFTSSDTTIATVPASVTVLAGQTTATFTVTSLNKTGTSNITGSIGGGSSAFATLSVTASATTWSPVDSRAIKPNSATYRTVQGSQIDDVQTSSNSAVPGVDSRIAAIKPTDSRISPNIPQNSRKAPPF